MVEATGKRRTWQLVLGVGLVFVCAGVAAVLWFAADDLHNDNVAGFARAPLDCDTTLNFEGTGRFVLYIETMGELDGVAGDCEASSPYAGAAPSGLQLELRDGQGDQLELLDFGGLSYDTGDFAGESNQAVLIDEPGDHVLSVTAADGTDFVVAVGRDPDDGVTLLRVAAILLMIGGLLAGGLLLVLGSRRRQVAAATPAPWQPTAPPNANWPSGPPGFPVPPPTTGATGIAGQPAMGGGPAADPLTDGTPQHPQGLVLPPVTNDPDPSPDPGSWGPPSANQ